MTVVVELIDALKCQSCDGEGGRIVPDCGDGCCHLREHCDECDGSGVAL